MTKNKTNIIVGMLILSLLCCDGRRQGGQAEGQTGENAGLKTKLRAEYQKRFGVSISEVELSMMRVCFSNGYDSRLSVTRDTTGNAITGYEYYFSPRRLELQLGIEEWLDFINALYRMRIHEWDSARRELFGDGRVGCPRLGGCPEWRLDIYFSGGGKCDSAENEYCADSVWKRGYSSSHTGWPNWAEFKHIIDSMAAVVKAKGWNVDALAFGDCDKNWFSGAE